MVSARRISKFLLQQEVDPSNVRQDPQEGTVYIYIQYIYIYCKA